jgi:hypothetical protein
MQRIFIAAALLAALASSGWAQSPQLYGSDGRYLGNLSANPYDPNSTSNRFGTYGSPFSPDSINNQFGMYGSPYSPYSATNPYAVQAPVIVAPMMPSYQMPQMPTLAPMPAMPTLQMPYSW